ncbi:hypothetical protein JOM56_009542 [Amanita muscaria]
MVRTRNFCLCLPARLGVFLVSVFNLVAGFSMGLFGWFEVMHLKNTPFTKAEDAALILHSVLFTLLGLVSLLGLTGAIIRHRSLVSLFGTMILLLLVINIGSGIYIIYTMFRNHGQVLLKECTTGEGHYSQETCAVASGLEQALIVMVYAVMWLVQICCFVIVMEYCHQLDDEEEEAMMAFMFAKPNGTEPAVGPSEILRLPV